MTSAFEDRSGSFFFIFHWEKLGPLIDLTSSAKRAMAYLLFTHINHNGFRIRKCFVYISGYLTQPFAFTSIVATFISIKSRPIKNETKNTRRKKGRNYHHSFVFSASLLSLNNIIHNNKQRAKSTTLHKLAQSWPVYSYQPQIFANIFIFYFDIA